MSSWTQIQVKHKDCLPHFDLEYIFLADVEKLMGNRNILDKSLC